MKNFVITVELEGGADSLKTALDRVAELNFGDNDFDYKIIGVREGRIEDPFLPFLDGENEGFAQWTERNKQ
jgi:hypothetical protein